MIKFFKKIRYNLMKTGKTGKYFKYAIGEILLVMVGILLALQVNNWNDKRIASDTERLTIEELQNNLQSDINDLEYNLTDDQRTLTSIDIVLQHLKEQGPFHDSLAQHFGLIKRYTNFINNSSAYQSLKSNGLNGIQDDGLRFKIIDYYEMTSKFLITIEEEFINSSETNHLQPFMIEHMNYETKFGPTFPKDHSALVNEGLLKNILINLKQEFEWKLELSNNCLNAAKELYNELEKI